MTKKKATKTESEYADRCEAAPELCIHVEHGEEDTRNGCACCFFYMAGHSNAETNGYNGYDDGYAEGRAEAKRNFAQEQKEEEKKTQAARTSKRAVAVAVEDVLFTLKSLSSSEREATANIVSRLVLHNLLDPAAGPQPEKKAAPRVPAYKPSTVAIIAAAKEAAKP